MATYVHNSNDLTPEMTANNLPSPNVVSSSTFNSPPWQAFCHDVSGSDKVFMTAVGNPTGWLKFDFGNGNTHAVHEYTLSFYPGPFFTFAPKTWTLQGSNNDSDWDVLDTQTDVATWGISEMRTYSFSNVTTYRYYKLDVTANQGSDTYLIIGELELFAIAPPIEYDLTFWDDGIPVIVTRDSNIINLTHWKDAEAFGGLVYNAENIYGCNAKIIIKDITTDNLDGKLYLEISNTNLLNGKIHTKDSELALLDAEIIIKKPVEIYALSDGKIEITTIPVGLVKIFIS